jgi:G:T-mismatch repair DNA endonuclease (very short patch repair protein)
VTRVWNRDSLIEKKLKQITNHNSQSTQYWMMKLKKNQLEKEKNLSQLN